MARQSYFPYGAIRAVSGVMPTKIAFTGQYTDDTGLMFFQARYYSSYLNRWIQPDTIVPDSVNPQSLNRFSYVLNNPLKYIDPTGHFEQEELAQLLGFESWDLLQQSDLWKGWSEAWRNMLQSKYAQLGSILASEVSGAIQYWMLAQRADNGLLGFWDINNKLAGDTQMFAQEPDRWALFASTLPKGLGDYLLTEHQTFGDVSGLKWPSLDWGESWPSTRRGWHAPDKFNGYFVMLNNKVDWGSLAWTGIGVGITAAGVAIPLTALTVVGVVFTAADVLRNNSSGAYISGVYPVIYSPVEYKGPDPISYCSMCFSR